jgi:tetratricopeptide (TPR) repeat protein
MWKWQWLRIAAGAVVLSTLCFAQATEQETVARASALVKAGKTKDAEALLRAASAAHPNSARLHGALGQLLLRDHNYEDSVQEFGLASQIEPDSEEYNLLLSEALLGWKHYGVALDFLNAVSAKFGGLAQFHYDRGIAYYNLNKMNEAQAEFQQAIKLSPNFDRAQFLLAACRLSMGDRTEGLDTLRALTKQHPDNSIYWSTLGKALGAAGGDEALHAVRQALKLTPNSAEAQFTAATVYGETGDFADARPLLEHLEKLNPKMIEIHVQLAHAYSRLGQRELARKETMIASQLQQENAAQVQATPSGQQSPAPEH